MDIKHGLTVSGEKMKTKLSKGGRTDYVAKEQARHSSHAVSKEGEGTQQTEEEKGTFGSLNHLSVRPSQKTFLFQKP